MAPPKKYPDELRERTTRMAVEARTDPASVIGAIKQIAEQLGIHEPIRLPPPVPDNHSQPLPDHAIALAWLDVHHPHLLAAQRIAATYQRHQAVWHLAWTLSTFQQRREHHHDALAVWQVATDAAAHLSDPAASIVARERLGRAHAELGRHEQAVELLQQAIGLTERHHDPTQQAHAHRVLTRVWELRNDHRQALEHARRALDLFRGLGQPVWEANALNSVGWFAAHLGDYDTARTHCQQALTLYQHHHSTTGTA
jgi:tetratricopeptide (TPR) repeat protein